MPKKFSKKEFRKWLDCIAKVTCKTDDNFTCQIRHDGECPGRMKPLSKNCQWCHIKSKKSYKVRWLPEDSITGCAHCHAWATDNPDDFIRWFERTYPHRVKVINEAMLKTNKIWKEKDFKEKEAELLQETVRIGVDYMNVCKRYRNRFQKKIEALKGGD